MRPRWLIARLRAEDIHWQPPNLTFTIVRHGAAVQGSTRGEKQRWILDVEQGVAEHYFAGFEQLTPMDRPLHIAPLAEEIVNKILEGLDDERYRWESSDKKAVRVLVAEFITGKFKQTIEGRRRNFRIALEKALVAADWVTVPGKRDVYALK